jgi:hypothetical protein
MTRSTLIAITAAVLLAAGPAAAQMTAELSAAHDTTLFQEGDLSNGAGDYLFAGPTNNGDDRRALIAFDIAGEVPAGATITEVELELRMTRTISGAETIGLHRVLADWGEAGSDASGQEGAGADAQSGDATWQHRFFSNETWSSAGGDFESVPSATLQVAGNGSYTWESTPQLVADVQSWLDSPSGNHGWILVMSSSGTAKRFNSRENASDPPVLKIEYTVEQASLDNFYFVAAAAKAAGAEGAFFLTDLDIVNGDNDTVTYQFLWMPRGQDNSIPDGSAEFTLGAGEAVRYSDVLGTVFGVTDGAVGALLVISDSSDLTIMSRTYNAPDDPGAGTFGQSIPGEEENDLIQAGERRRIIFFTENGDFRSNLGLLNGTSRSITIMWERFTADGSSLGTGSRTLPPYGNVQLNRVFSDVAPVEAAYIDVWTDTTGGAFSAYGSVLDNDSSDPTTVLPQ